MNTTEKLQTLIPHWMEHNEEHAGEFRQWAEQEATAASADLLSAAEAMSQVNRALAAALEKLGRAASHSHPHSH